MLLGLLRVTVHTSATCGRLNEMHGNTLVEDHRASAQFGVLSVLLSPFFPFSDSSTRG